MRLAASAKDYDRVDGLLSKAKEAQDRSLEVAEALEREAHEAANRLRRGKAATRAERGELSLTRVGLSPSRAAFPVCRQPHRW